MLKKQKVVLLPTNEKAENCLWMGTAKDSILLNKLSIGFPYGKETHSLKPYYLYVLSDDKIEKNDWFCYWDDFEKHWFIFQCKSNIKDYCIKTVGNHGIDCRQEYCKKIIATTDSLNTSDKVFHDTFKQILPKPSQSFINKYIEKYNKGEQINEVMVEYIDNGEEGWMGDNYNGEPFWNERIELKVNSKDNTITIKAVKESWNRAEVKDLIYSFRNSILIEVSKGQVSNFTDNWIEQNL